MVRENIIIFSVLTNLFYSNINCPNQTFTLCFKKCLNVIVRALLQNKLSYYEMLITVTTFSLILLNVKTQNNIKINLVDWYFYSRRIRCVKCWIYLFV